MLLALPGLELGVTDASSNDIFTSWIPHIPECKWHGERAGGRQMLRGWCVFYFAGRNNFRACLLSLWSPYRESRSPFMWDTSCNSLHRTTLCVRPQQIFHWVPVWSLGITKGLKQLLWHSTFLTFLNLLLWTAAKYEIAKQVSFTVLWKYWVALIEETCWQPSTVLADAIFYTLHCSFQQFCHLCTSLIIWKSSFQGDVS